jgi:hypothetical protein
MILSTAVLREKTLGLIDAADLPAFSRDKTISL